MQSLSRIPALSIACLLTAITPVESILPATALPTQGTLVAQMSRRRLSFRVGVRPTRYRLGGFSRGGSCTKAQAPVALVPPPQPQERLSRTQATVDKTASDRPTFFVYLPNLPGRKAHFTLQNEAGTDELYNTRIDLPSQDGIVGIALPDKAPALQVGQKYLWQLALACDSDDPSNATIISGWIERVNPPTTRGDRLTALAEQGIWQDTLTLVALQRFQRPGDRATAEDWAALMEQAGLGQFKQARIVQIVKK